MTTNINQQASTKSDGTGKSMLSSKIKSFPAVKQLATPTDLKPEVV